MEEDEEYTTKSGKKHTGKLKYIDKSGVGYVISGEDSVEYLITPSSFPDQNFQFQTLEEDDYVTFTPKFRSTIPKFKAFDVNPFQLKCFYCRKIGHFSKNCPFRKTSKVRCYRCGLIGYSFWNCLDCFPSSKINSGFCKKVESFKWVGQNISGSLISVKNVEDLRKYEEIEDCFILDFDPFKIDQGKVEIEENYERLKSVKKVEDLEKFEEDNDCFVLEFDPNESVCESKSERETVFLEDEMTVLAVKGQVACRDYPHPRHLCAKHPFDKTVHSMHCEKCYCCICDIPAPCDEWTEGSMHCDASDKSVWKEFE